MSKDKITYRIDEEELTDLRAEAARRRMSVDCVARERMRSWGKVRKRLGAMKKEVTELRQEVSRLLVALAKVCTVLLCRGGKESFEAADRWVKDNILRK
jgi:hypothetical protein